MSEKYSVLKNTDTLKIVLPYRTEWSKVILGLFGIGIGLFIFAPIVFSPLLIAFKENRFENLDPLLSFFFLGILFILSIFLVEILWQSIGKEVIGISNEFVVIRHQIFGIGISKKLYQNKIVGIFIAETREHPPTFRRSEFLSFYRGYLEIRYKNIFNGISVYRLGSILEKEDTGEIITILENKFPKNKAAPKIAG